VSRDLDPYDAFLLVSFGGPEKPEDVVPFLKNVTRGRSIPPGRLEQVGEHYFLFGGRSPINDQCRALIAAIASDFRECGIEVPIYWGNRNWEPYLRDTVRQMAADGVSRAACFVTSPYSSYSGCRQYRENLFDATDGVDGAPRLDRLRHYYNHPGFVEPLADSTRAAVGILPADSRLVFVTHSIPETMAATAGPEGRAYERQHRLVASEVARRVGAEEWDLAFCSRSGTPRIPWLQPDINDHVEALAKQSAPGVAVVPIGFVSDHMEVIYDLDIEAAATAEKAGVEFARASTAGLDPRFVAMVRDLLLERAAVERGTEPRRLSVGSLGPSWDVCPVGCCPNARGDKPALCGRD
jgi:protoporphyrin/coproporphyrin ferrochelatase